MSDERSPMDEAIHDLIDANARARAQLDATDAMLQRGIDHLRAGGGVVDALRLLPIAQRRQSTQDAFQEVILARHRLRLRAISACTEQGLSPARIAEIWGISRQRVVQFVAEARKQAT